MQHNTRNQHSHVHQDETYHGQRWGYESTSSNQESKARRDITVYLDHSKTVWDLRHDMTHLEWNPKVRYCFHFQGLNKETVFTLSPKPTGRQHRNGIVEFDFACRRGTQFAAMSGSYYERRMRNYIPGHYETTRLIKDRYHPKCPKIYLEYKTGWNLREDMMNLVWDPSLRYYFYFSRACHELLFTITPRSTPKQGKNGVIVFFSSNGSRTSPSYEKLRPIFRAGFAARYQRLFFYRFPHDQVKLHDPYFQAFVLLQFEIARRVPWDGPTFLSRNQTAYCIEKAILCDTAEAYESLLRIFEGDNRWPSYKQLMTLSCQK